MGRRHSMVSDNCTVYIARKEQTMSDLIKRSDVIKIVRHISMEFVDADTRQKLIEEIPSADRLQGEWIFKTVFPNDKSEFPMGYLVCSVCGSHHSNSTPCNYCDNCGARMKGAADEID